MGTTYKSMLFIFIAFTLTGNIAYSDHPCRGEVTQAKELALGGIHFSGESHCVEANTDAAAGEACKKGVGGWQFAVNVGNKNYSGSVGNGKFDSNDVGYYMCIMKTPSMADFNAANPGVAEKLQNQSWFREGNIELNNKKTMCEDIASVASPWLSQGPGYEQLQFRWDGTSKDGICLAGYEGGRFSQTGEAPPPPPPEIVAASIQSQNPQNPTATSTPAAAVTASGVDERLNRCIQSHISKAELCETEAEAAKNSCDENNPNNVGNRNSSPTQMASGATQIMGQVYNMQNQASGMQAECFRAGAVANTASTAIGEMQTTCKSNLTSCGRVCNGNDGETKLAEYKRLCADAIGRTTADLEADRATPNGVAYNDAAARIQGIVEPALRVCTVDAQKNKDTLSKLMEGVGRALQASVQCACQTSSTGENCQNIPPVRDCSMIPQPPGCGGYEAMATCSVGAPGYNAKECGCMQNPAAPGCGGGSNAISAFSGPPIANNLARGAQGGGVNFSGGGGGRASNLTFGPNGEVENGDLSFLNGGSKSGAEVANSVGSGGAAGPGGGSNGAATDDKGGVAAEEDKGLGGIFNQAKTFMSNALGRFGKKPASAKRGNGALGKQPNMGRFKPLRGLAGRSGGMGSRNMDIWKMMNACTSGDTCKSNENNYLVTP